MTPSRLCPPGYYMLFVINNAGVPSVAKMIQVLPQNPPAIVMVCPANGGIVEPYRANPERLIKVSAKVRDPAAVQRVDFYQGVQPIAQVPASQASDGHYSAIWIQRNPGSYILTAKAVMANNSEVQSEPITVQVTSFPAAPSPTIQPPPGGVAGFDHYAFPVRISASAGGSIALLELYAEHPFTERLNWTVLLTSTTGNTISEFPYTWPRARSGHKYISTVVRNDAGVEREDLGYGRAEITLFGGGLDTTFRPASPSLDINNTVRGLAIQSDGKILIAGDFTTVDGTGRNRIARFNANGTLDTSFNPGSGANGAVYSVAVQRIVENGVPVEKVLIGGAFTEVNDVTRTRIARLDPNGYLDTGFNPGANGAVHALAVQTIGTESKVLLGGAFTSVAGDTRNRIARLNANGSLDAGFNPGVTGGAAPVVYSVAVQAQDAKVLVGGDFTTVAGQTRNRVARLTAGGGLDNDFQSGLAGADAPVRSVALQKDGKIVIGGDFAFVNGQPRNRIGRLNANGSLDTGFQNGLSGADAAVYAVAVQSDGKVLIGGAFTSVNGTTRNRIGRLNGDGNLDDSFRPGPADQVAQYGPDNVVRSVVIQADGLTVVGGEFSTYKVPGQNAQGNPQPLSADPRVARVGGL